MANVPAASSGKAPAGNTKPSPWDTSTMKDVDSKESLDRFLAAAHFTGKPKKAILPVPGVAPHLWHLHQGKKDGTVTTQPAYNTGLVGLQARPKPAAGDQMAARYNDNSAKGLQTRPQPQKNLNTPWESVSPKASSPSNFHEAYWPETKRAPPPIVHWTEQLGIDRIQLPSGHVTDNKLPDLRKDLEYEGEQDGHRNVARNAQQIETSAPANLQLFTGPKPFVPPSQVKPDNTRRNEPSIHDSQKIPPLYRSFIPAESNKRPSAASNEAAASNGGQREDDIGLSRHLDTFRKTYRNRAESIISHNSLDSLSTIRSHRATAPDTKDTGAQPRSDIRSTIAPVHHLHDYGDKWIKVNWNAGRGENPDDDSIFVNRNFVTKFILSWLKDHDYEVLVNLEVQNHWKSDIETDTGRLLMPVEMPETVPNPAPDVDEATAYRHQNMNSAMMSRREVRGKDNRTQKGDRSGRKDTAKNRKNQAPLVSRHDLSTPSLKESTNDIAPAPVGLKGSLALGTWSNYSPSVPCYLRPANKNDMGAVTRIYNREVTEGLQALDSSPLSVGDFENILSTAEKLGMPFIVAVRGSARDFEHKSGNLEFSPYTQLAPYAHDPLDTKQNGNVLGFAYLSVWEPGLAGDGNGSSRATARINLFVDPKYRKKKIGSSLLDKLMSTASRRFSSLSGYDFVDLSNSPVYKHPLGHERKYFRLYLNYSVKHAHNVFDNEELEREQQSYGDDLVWVKKLLEERFGFTEKERFETVFRSSKHVDGRPVYWMDSVVFEHTCHLDARFTTDY